MIKASINGNAITFEKERYETFKDFYEDNKLTNKILSRVVINNNEVPVSMIDEIYNASFDGGEEIVLDFEELVPFTLNLLSNLEGYITQFETALPVFANEIKTGSAASVEGLKNIQEGLKALETMKVNLFALTGTDENDYPGLQSKKAELHSILEKMNTAIMEKDWNELSQLLETDFPEAISYYGDLFTKSKEILKQRKA
ncbi:MAG TPA: hypothetical protein PK466_10080 [Thermotogota bacterium]|nr:hypothetical protein [Thermotogota bacterium]HPJ88807.1 hypothetical protein [Thermotogota bacterium]HPR96670.1 hypothetical protein [Thermotogota bacterium]